MQRTAWRLLAGLAALLTGLAAIRESTANEQKQEGVVIRLDNFQSRTPAEWKQEPPSNKMRFAQFRLPRVKDDKDDAELVIFQDAGGSAKDNVARWKGQFLAPQGKNIDDATKVTDIKIAGLEATLVDIAGIYLYKTRPFDPQDKGEKRPDYRMLAIHFKAPEHLYHIKLTGPARTVEHYKKGFDEWIKAFK
jgi:hypothetical protein